MSNKKKNVCVVVLGDIGRSPRMQYHALSLAQSDYNVDLLGYPGSKPLEEILEHENIKITNLTPLPEFNGPKILQYLLKVFWQTISLLLTFAIKRKSDFVLCQNPPAIPTLFVCWLYCLVVRAKFIIDWHNYAFSIMALTHGKSAVVTIARQFEFFFGAQAHANLCVTNAMKEDLLQHKINAKVLYDRPADIFHPISDKEKHDFIAKLSTEYTEFALTKKAKLNSPTTTDVGKTIITEWDGSQIIYRDPRPGILFSSTSWTPDEDFQILLSALEDYDKSSFISNILPKLICVITGKGPMKDYYIDLIKSKQLNNVQVVTPWLEVKDYPLMVASADLGVCLHTSSSGLDLPMKVVDMFGSGLPVCAFKYQCLHELVKDKENGYVFENAKDLANKIKMWFERFPNNKEQNDVSKKFKDNLQMFYTQKWHGNWENRAKPLFS